MDFARPPFIEGPALSPDGSHFAAKLTVDGKQMFAIIALAGGPPKLAGVGDMDLNWWRWVNNDWLVVGVGDSQPVQGDQWYVRRAVAISADAKTVRVLKPHDGLGQNADTLIWTARDGSARVLLGIQQSIYAGNDGIYPGVFEFDLANGKVRTIVRPYSGVDRWFADGNGIVRMGVASSMPGALRACCTGPPAMASSRPWTVPTLARAPP